MASSNIFIKKVGVLMKYLCDKSDKPRVCYPSAAASGPFCLLCCQPKPIRDSSTPRNPNITIRIP